MVYFEYYHKEPQIAGELCQILEASGQVVPDDLRRIAREVEEGHCLLGKKRKKLGWWWWWWWWWVVIFFTYMHIFFEVLRALCLA